MTSVAERIASFADVCRDQSPLYAALCPQIANDRQLVEIAAATPPGQPVANLFLASVHFLLLSGREHELRSGYPSCCETPRAAANVFPTFRDFVLQFEGEIRQLLATRRVQTNEVGRCAYLLPAFSTIARTTGRPIFLIEIGTSAGLLLNFDRYSYEYGDENDIAGRSAAIIRSRFRGEPPPFSAPDVSGRVGIDLHTVDVTQEHEAIWLRSLIWPDQPSRMALLDAAIAEQQRSPVRLVEGDALDILPREIDRVPPNVDACVFHCHVLNQFTDDQRREFDEMMANVSSYRAVFEVGAEWIKTPTAELTLTTWQHGTPLRERLAKVDHHGRWIEWTAK